VPDVLVRAMAAVVLGQQGTARLCSMSARLCSMSLQGLLSDRLVHTTYVDSFRQLAAYLMDHAAVEAARHAFLQTYVLDERMPLSPTRW